MCALIFCFSLKGFLPKFIEIFSIVSILRLKQSSFILDLKPSNTKAFLTLFFKIIYKIYEISIFFFKIIKKN